MANEPENHGLNFWLAVDIKNKYLFNAYPYRKNEQEAKKTNLGQD